MTARQVIDKAKARLVNDRYLTSVLNSTGSVSVPVLMPGPVTWQADDPPSPDGAPIVVFTIEQTAFGKRLMAEYNGRKEFAA